MSIGIILKLIWQQNSKYLVIVNRLMLSSGKKKSKSQHAQLIDQLTEMILKAEALTQKTYEDYLSSSQYLKNINQQLNQLQHEIQVLSNAESLLKPVIENNQLKSIHIQSQISILQISERQQQNQHGLQSAKPQNLIEVILPKLNNLQECFDEILDNEFLQAYLKHRDLNKQEQMKHQQQKQRLEEKLKNVDEKVNETLNALKNQRRQF